LILRDSPAGLEVFMVERHREIDFASGALVFPGGKVDAQDSADDWVAFAPCAAMAPDRSFLIAAAREAFEEAGLLLARRRGSQAMLVADETEPLVERWRAGVLDGSIPFLDILKREELELASDLMVPFAHWITPEGLPKRYDTHFFLVAAPVGQLGAHDGFESVDAVWIPPAQALADAEAGRRTLVFATQMNLSKLARYRTVAEAVTGTRQEKVVTVMPRIERGAAGRTLHIPAEAGYGITQMLFPRQA
jgi:8-oxo-dGTP pyrophosphatase MutT (NUDIX family)